jgi:hypothetical protein
MADPSGVSPVQIAKHSRSASTTRGEITGGQKGHRSSPLTRETVPAGAAARRPVIAEQHRAADSSMNGDVRR